jgi:hypothetical protein
MCVDRWLVQTCSPQNLQRALPGETYTLCIPHQHEWRVAGRQADRGEHAHHARVQPPAWRRASTQRLHAVRDEGADLEALERLLDESAQLSGAGRKARRGHERDRFSQRRSQPNALKRFGLDEDHRANGAVAVIRMLHVRLHDHAVRRPPIGVPLATDSHCSLERDDDLNRVVRMRRDDAFAAADGAEPALPQVPVRRARPARRVRVLVDATQPSLFLADGDVEVEHVFAQAKLRVESNRGIVAEVGLHEDHIGAA